MITVLNITSEPDARSRVFFDSPVHLKELLEHVDRVVEDCGHQRFVIADKTTQPFLSGTGILVDTMVEAGPDSVQSMAVWLRSLTGIPSGESLLVISPFKGVVGSGLVREFLDKAEDCRCCVSASRVGVNVNPFWMNRISPLSRVGDATYVDRNTTKLPKFNRDSNIVNKEQWQRLVGDLKIYGSQWLPELYKVNGAIALVQDGAGGEYVPVLLDAPAGDDLPLLYRLPIFDMARHQFVSLGPSAAVASTARSLNDARTAMHSPGFEEDKAGSLMAVNAVGIFRL